jgi:hypothetical protein
MKSHHLLTLLALAAMPVSAENNTPPEGFTALFNGKDLSGWYGWSTKDPTELWNMTPEERADYKKKSVEGGLPEGKAGPENINAHWKVVDGEIVNDGKGLYLTTDKDYGDFELWVEYKALPEGDSGVYLRGIPQVQIWDSTQGDPRGLGQDKGSGGLWNNSKGAPGKDPLLKMDKPFGEWNQFKIRMIGERVTVVFNGQTVVNNAVLENFFANKKAGYLAYGKPAQKKAPPAGDKKDAAAAPNKATPKAEKKDGSAGEKTGKDTVAPGEAPKVAAAATGAAEKKEDKLPNGWMKDPIFPKGPIQLQTHGSEIRWRNVFIREIPPQEADQILASDGFVEQINGKDLSNWQGAVDSYEVKDGSVVCKPGKGGDLLTSEQYGDCVIRVEFKLPPAGNNGIALRTPLGGHSASDGFELQVIDSDGYNAKQAAAGKPGLLPYQYHGSLYHCVGAKHGYLRPVGEWNFEEIEVQGQKIKVTLNGTKILDVDVDTLDRSQIAHPPKGLDHTVGYIGFAGHNDPVEFRSFKVKRM